VKPLKVTFYLKCNPVDLVTNQMTG